MNTSLRAILLALAAAVPVTAAHAVPELRETDAGTRYRPVAPRLPATPSPRPKVTVAPRRLDFGKVLRNRSVTRTVTITNTGKVDVVMHIIPPEAPFTVVPGGVDFPLRRGKKKRIRVRFHPTQEGTFRSRMDIELVQPGRATYLLPLRGASR
jgi:hypothetical protein